MKLRLLMLVIMANAGCRPVNQAAFEDEAHYRFKTYQAWTNIYVGQVDLRLLMTNTSVVSVDVIDEKIEL